MADTAGRVARSHFRAMTDTAESAVLFFMGSAFAGWWGSSRVRLDLQQASAVFVLGTTSKFELATCHCSAALAITTL